MSAIARSELEEIARRGEELYAQGIRQTVEPGNVGKYVAIDIHTGQYEVGGHLEAINTLHDRVLNAEVYTIKIGYPATAVIGGGLRPDSEKGLSHRPIGISQIRKA